jgi:putative ABC transport system substrate-binding protein
MKRREFISLFGCAAATWPFAAQAQLTDRKELPAIGFLYLGWERGAVEAVEALRSGLAALGYTEGQNIRLHYRIAEGRAERLSGLTTELAALGVKVIVTAFGSSRPCGGT